MRRPHAVSRTTLGVVVAVLLPMSFALAGCGSDDAGGAAAKVAAPGPASTTSDGAGSPEAVALDGDAEGLPSGFAMGADVASFCTAMQDADDTVDGARPGSADDWLQVVAALDRIYEVGVPEDFPAPALRELDVLDRLVRESGSVAELGRAVRREKAATGAIDDYLRAACTE